MVSQLFANENAETKYTDLFDVVICKANSITSKLEIIFSVKWICVLCTTNAVFYVH